MVLKELGEHFNPTLHCDLLISVVWFPFKHISHSIANNICIEGESIGRALQSNTSLQSLNIAGVISFVTHSNIFQHTTGNSIGDYGAESIGRALQSNTSLQSLNIAGVISIQTPFHT